MARGALDAQGIWQYGEDDFSDTFSGLLNKGMASVSAALAKIGAGAGKVTGYINVVDLGADPTGVKDSTAVLRQAFATPSAIIYMPPGRYLHQGLLKIAPNVSIYGYGAVLRLAPMSRVHSVVTDPAVNNGRVTLIGFTIDGRDADQGDEAADGNAYDVSKGANLANGIRLNLIDVNVRHTRGHGINHWSWDYLFVRNYQVMQMVNPVAPAGGRRRDGITGVSRHIDIRGVSGYTADDLVAVGAGIRWGAMGAAGGWDIETVNISGVSAQVAETDDEVKAWRAVAIYAQNGGKFGSIVVSDVTGETKSGHLMVKAYAEAGQNDPEAGTGFVGSLAVSNLSGRTQTFSEFEAFMSVSGIEVENMVVSNVARQAESTSYGGGTIVPVSPTLLLRNNAHVRSLMLDNVATTADERGAARDANLVLLTTGAILDRVHYGNVSYVHPYATSEANVRMLRKAADAAPVVTMVSGLSSPQSAGLRIVSNPTPGNGSDANFLVATGRYYNVLPNIGNWPWTSGYQAMQVERAPSGEVSQFVMRAGQGGSSALSSRTLVNDVWTAWVPINVLALTKWQEGIDATAALISPSLLRSVLVREMSTGTRQAAKDTTIQPGTQVWDTSLNKMTRCKSRSDQTLNAAIVWTDLNGNPV